MTDLFTRLAERARGTAAPIAARLPARFERSPQADPIDLDEEAAAASTVDSPPRRDPGPSPLGQAPPPPTGRTSEVTHQERHSHVERVEVRSSKEVTVPVAVSRQPAAELPRPLPVPAAAAPAPINAQAPHAIRPAPPVIEVRTVHQPARGREGQTAVHINIGRIEVRAAAPPPASIPHLPSPPSPVASSPAPEGKRLGLAEYLRGDDGRPR